MGTALHFATTLVYSRAMKDPVVQEGDPVLRKKAKPVAEKSMRSKTTQALIARMKKVLAGEEYGVAIAAPQVGASVQLFVVSGRVFMPEDAKEDAKRPDDKVFINPEIIRLSRARHEMSEGCLSVRGKYGTVVRHEKTSIRAMGEDGKPFTYNATGLLAHIFQHEIDHLNGILYTDKTKKLTNDADREDLRERFPSGGKPKNISSHE